MNSSTSNPPASPEIIPDDIINIQGWFDWPNLYDRMAREVPHFGTIIELGVWRGKSLCYLAWRLRQLGRCDVNLIGVDNWTHSDWDGYASIVNVDRARGNHKSIYDQCCENLRKVGVFETVTLMSSDSIEAASQFGDGEVDFIFVDDTHNEDHVRRELAAWKPKMRRPTWIAGHDYPGLICEGVLDHFPDAEHDGNCWIARMP